MPDTAPSTRKPPLSDDAIIAALAQQTDTAHDVVKHIYDEEIAALHAKSTVKNFIGVIARRRAKQRLLALKRKAH